MAPNIIAMFQARLMRSVLGFLPWFGFSIAAQAQDPEWQRVVCIDDPRVTVTLIVKSVATAADEEFIGFELHNKTDQPVRIASSSDYRLETTDVFPRQPEKNACRQPPLGSGSLLERSTPSTDSIAPGVTRSVRSSSAYSLALLGLPAGTGCEYECRAHVELRFGERGKEVSVATPTAGVPFRFTWRPPDEKGLEALRERFLRVLQAPEGQWLESAWFLGLCFKTPTIVSRASVAELLVGLERHEQSRPKIRDYIDANFATDPAVAEFFLNKVIPQWNHHLLSELAQAPHIRDRRFIEPLVRSIREKGTWVHWCHFALTVLARHRDLMPDRDTITRELGERTFARTKHVAEGTIPKGAEFRWSRELQDLALTGDKGLIPALIPYLDRKEVVEDPQLQSVMTNNVPTRACDHAYNAMLDLLDRTGERFSMFDFTRFDRATGRPKPAEEHERRDKLIATLRVELSRR